jgi:hypothetical protein
VKLGAGQQPVGGGDLGGDVGGRATILLLIKYVINSKRRMALTADVPMFDRYCCVEALDTSMHFYVIVKSICDESAKEDVRHIVVASHDTILQNGSGAVSHDRFGNFH